MKCFHTSILFKPYNSMVSILEIIMGTESA